MSTPSTRRPTDDSGAMLVVALLVITTVALVTGAVLTQGRTAFVSTVELREVATTSYAADAAADLALDNLRRGSLAAEWSTPGFDGTWNDGRWNGWVYSNYADGTGCFGALGTVPRDSLTFPGVVPRSGSRSSDPSARVECTPVAGTGILGGAAGVTIADPDSTNPFSRALTTLGTAPGACGPSVTASCNGTFFKVLGTGASGAKLAAPLAGGVASATGVVVDNGTLTTDGYVFALGACTGSIIASPKECNRSSIPAVDVPPSPLGTTIPPAVPTLPTPVSGVCTFEPGTYVDSEALTAAMGASGPAARRCTASHFRPGVYYFDFVDPSKPWELAGKVVGGELTGPLGSTAVPGACRSPITTPGAVAGVSFVFGGASRMTVANGAEVELCGGSTPDGSAPLTVYQQQADGGATTVVTPPPVTTETSKGPGTATAVTTTTAKPDEVDAFLPSNGSTLVDDARTADGKVTTWTSSRDGNVGDLLLGGFPDGIPAGATVTSASVEVVLANPGGNRAAEGTFRLGGDEIGRTSKSTTFTLTASQLAALQSKVPTGSGSYAPDVKVSLTRSGQGQNLLPKQGTSLGVDRISLSFTYRTTTQPPPITVTPEGASRTVFLATKPNAAARFVVQGAFYAPDGTIDVDAGQTAFIAFRWGLVAHGVSLKTFPQQVFGFPLISIPEPGAGLGRDVTVVDLEVFVCEDGGACSSGGVHALTVRALIADPVVSPHPVEGRRRIRILSWAAQR